MLNQVRIPLRQHFSRKIPPEMNPPKCEYRMKMICETEKAYKRTDTCFKWSVKEEEAERTVRFNLLFIDRML